MTQTTADILQQVLDRQLAQTDRLLEQNGILLEQNKELLDDFGQLRERLTAIEAELRQIKTLERCGDEQGARVKEIEQRLVIVERDAAVTKVKGSMLGLGAGGAGGALANVLLRLFGG